MRVVCYNLNQVEHSEAVVKLLSHFKADILFLQEAMIWSEVEWLAGQLGLHAWPRAWTRGGYTVLTHKPATKFWSAIVPASKWGAGAAGVQIGDVWYISLHLDDANYRRDDKVRMHELRYILSKLPPGRAILAGDFNSPSHLDKAADLPSKLFTPPWRDVQAGKTWTRGTWMPSDSNARIDRIYSRGVTAGRGGIVDHHDMGWSRWPTGRDHRLLWHQFKL